MVIGLHCFTLDIPIDYSFQGYEPSIQMTVRSWSWIIHHGNRDRGQTPLILHLSDWYLYNLSFITIIDNIHTETLYRFSLHSELFKNDVYSYKKSWRSLKWSEMVYQWKYTKMTCRKQEHYNLKGKRFHTIGVRTVAQGCTKSYFCFKCPAIDLSGTFYFVKRRQIFHFRPIYNPKKSRRRE